jgi:hypothetical protein
MKMKKAGEETLRVDPTFSLVVDVFANDDQVSCGKGKGFGSGALKVNGKIFAMMSSNEKFVVKLPKKRVDDLVHSGKGEYFDPGHGRLMKEWVVLKVARSDWADFAKEASSAKQKREKLRERLNRDERLKGKIHHD